MCKNFNLYVNKKLLCLWVNKTPPEIDLKKKKKKKTGKETVQKHTQKPLNTGHSIVYWYNIVYYLILYVMLIS